MFRRDALLLVGHGSALVPDAARPLLIHADVIRDSRCFGEVEVGMLLGEPDLDSVFSKLNAPVIQVVPFFLDDGYFTRIVIPDRLLLLSSGSRLIRFCPPIGLHAGISALLETRLLRHCEMFGTDPKSLSVLLVGHGSAANPGRARALQRHADSIEAKAVFGRVRVAFLEEAPFVAEALAGARGHVVAVVGYLANQGMHATGDLPGLIAAERSLRGTNWPPVHDVGTIGTDEGLPRLIMDQVTTTKTA